MAKMNYLTMKQAYDIYKQYFVSPASDKAMLELIRRRSEVYGLKCRPEKRGGLLTVTRNQLDVFLANVQEYPTGKQTRKVRRQFKQARGKRWPGGQPATSAKPPPHRQPWSWSKNIRQPVRRNWAASQGQRNES